MTHHLKSVLKARQQVMDITVQAPGIASSWTEGTGDCLRTHYSYAVLNMVRNFIAKKVQSAVRNFIAKKVQSVCRTCIKLTLKMHSNTH